MPRLRRAADPAAGQSYRRRSGDRRGVEGGGAVKNVLLGRLALVTGAGHGNGAAIARGLAVAGAEVIVTDIDKEAARAIADSIVADGGRARGFMLDVTDEEGRRKLAQDLSLLVGPVSILINNAGIFLRGDLVADDGRSRWEK